MPISSLSATSDILPASLGEMSNIDIAPTIERILGVTPAGTVLGEALLLGPAPLTMVNAAPAKPTARLDSSISACLSRALAAWNPVPPR